MAKEHSCKCASCTASAKQATMRERERIMELLRLNTVGICHLCDYDVAEVLALIREEN